MLCGHVPIAWRRKGKELLDHRPSAHAYNPRLLWTWLALVALSQLADVATTWGSLAAGLSEGNPVVAAALGSGQFLLFAMVKVSLVVAFGIVLLRGRRAALTAARLLVALFSAIAIGNLLSAVTG